MIVNPTKLFIALAYKLVAISGSHYYAKILVYVGIIKLLYDMSS